MPMTQKIHIISDDDEFVILMKLLGIAGTILKDSNAFLEVFNELKKDKSISIILISMELPETIIENLLEFKLNNTRPFIFLIPDLFEEHAEEKSVFLKRIYKKANKLLI
ncbi:MAG: putative ATP synthase (F/14-kDa) subunit [Promethearchaeota archaeon]|nr:MAG: putative ATP synthase (F/14-kDa) subunit [Candidatus Lokiarchaeota archaeon]